jgi:hypothetical protein
MQYRWSVEDAEKAVGRKKGDTDNQLFTRYFKKKGKDA